MFYVYSLGSPRLSIKAAFLVRTSLLAQGQTGGQGRARVTCEAPGTSAPGLWGWMRSALCDPRGGALSPKVSVLVRE